MSESVETSGEKKPRQRPRSKRIVELLLSMRGDGGDGLTVRQIAERFYGSGDVAARKRAHSLLHALKIRGLLERCMDADRGVLEMGADGLQTMVPIYVAADPFEVMRRPEPVLAQAQKAVRMPVPIVPIELPSPEEVAPEPPDSAVVEAMELAAEADRRRWFTSWKTVEFVCCEPKEPISLVVREMVLWRKPVLAWVLARKIGMAEYIVMRYLKRLCAEGLAWRSYGKEDVPHFALSDRCRIMLGEKLLFSGDM